MSIFDNDVWWVWVTLLLPNDSERISGRLVQKGYGVKPIQKNLVLSAPNRPHALLSMEVSGFNCLKTTEVSEIIRGSLSELNILYHSIVLLKPYSGEAGWSLGDWPPIKEELK